MTPGFSGIEEGQKSDPRRPCQPVAKHSLPLHCPSLPVLSGTGAAGGLEGGRQVLTLTGSREETIVEHGAPTPLLPPSVQGNLPTLPTPCPPLWEQQGAQAALYPQPWGANPPGGCRAPGLPSWNKHSPPSRHGPSRAFAGLGPCYEVRREAGTQRCYQAGTGQVSCTSH